MNTSLDFSEMSVAELKTLRQDIEWEISERIADHARRDIAFIHSMLSGLKTTYGCDFCIVNNSLVITNGETGEVMAELDVTTL